MVWLPVLVPFLGAVAILVLRRHRFLIGMLAAGVMALTLAAAVWAAIVQSSAAWSWGPGIELEVAVEGLARLMVVLVPTIALAVMAYTVVHESDDRALPRLLAFLTVFVGAMELLVVAADFLTLLIGWELVGAVSYALISHDWIDPNRTRSAREAFVTTRLGDVGLYLAAGAAFAASGGFRYDDLAAAPSGGPFLPIVAGGVLVAAAAKSAQLPFSPWLFSAMAGPTPVSALLHSATMVAAGAYALARLQPALDQVAWFGPAVVTLGLTTSLAGGVVALLQTDFKKALAGSTSAQYGLMLIGIGAGYTAAAAGQLTAHAVFKALLFLGAGIAANAGGTLELGKLRLGSSLPRVAALFGVGALALAAVPPLGGAFTKEAILAAATSAGTWVAAGTAFSGVITALYAGRIYLLGYGPGPRRIAEEKPHRIEVTVLGLLAGLSLLLGALWLPGGARILEDATGGSLAEGEAWELLVSIGGIALAALVLFVLWRRDHLETFALPERVRAWLAGWWGLPTAARVLVVDPVLRLAKVLRRGDLEVIDAAVRTVAWTASAASAVLRRGVEQMVDAIVNGVGGGTLRSAEVSRLADEAGVDGAVEGLARGFGVAGTSSRRLQTGMSHHYYIVLAAGAVVVVAVAAIWR